MEILRCDNWLIVRLTIVKTVLVGTGTAFPIVNCISFCMFGYCQYVV
jgi:hypothetical protein